MKDLFISSSSMHAGSGFKAKRGTDEVIHLEITMDHTPDIPPCFVFGNQPSALLEKRFELFCAPDLSCLFALLRLGFRLSIRHA